MNGASERANERASGPVLSSVSILTILSKQKIRPSFASGAWKDPRTTVEIPKEYGNLSHGVTPRRFRKGKNGSECVAFPRPMATGKIFQVILHDLSNRKENDLLFSPVSQLLPVFFFLNCLHMKVQGFIWPQRSVILIEV